MVLALVSQPDSATVEPSFSVLQGPGGVEVHLASTDKYRGVLVHWLAEAQPGAQRAAWALLPDLLTRGNRSFPELSQLAARCEELHGSDLLSSVSAHGPTQLLQFGFETVADSQLGGRALFADVVELAAECLHRPALADGRFRQDHLAQEQLNLLRAIESLSDDKGLLAYRRMIEAMHRGSDLARHSWGTVEEARSLDEDVVHQAWDALRDRAPARLLILGDVDESAALAAAEQLAGGTDHGEPTVSAPPPPAQVRAVQELRDAEPLSQSQLVMGFRLPPEVLAGPAPLLFATAFGGASHSRLFKRVREADGLAYSCSASMLIQSGTLVVQAGVDVGAIERVREAVQDELLRFVEEGLDADEFELSRSAQLRRLRQLEDTPRGLLGFRLHGLCSGRTHELPAALEAVSSCQPDELLEVARAAVLDTVYVLEGSGS